MSYEVQPNGCWWWTGPIDRYGYGYRGKRLAHRTAYEAAHGPVPHGLQIDHTCHNADVSCSGGDGCMHRRCVNPAHLQAVTPAVNKARGHNFMTARATATQCHAGHPFDEANTYIRPGTGTRQCKACRRQALRDFHARRRAA